MSDRSQWTVAAKLVALRREPQDKGVGDTFQRIVARFHANELAALYTLIMGHDCGCKDRQARMNVRYPYSDVT